MKAKQIPWNKDTSKKWALLKDGTSYCPTCDKVKPISDFYKDKSGRGGVSFYCKICSSKKNKNTYKKFKLNWRNRQLKKKFGISLVEYGELLKSQNNQCAICGKKPEKGKPTLPLDHDHKTGKVRGILCEPCNKGLGMFHDDTDRLINAIEYLKSPPAKCRA